MGDGAQRQRGVDARRTSGPIDAEQQAVLFYMYTNNVAALREALLGTGVADATAGATTQHRTKGLPDHTSGLHARGRNACHRSGRLCNSRGPASAVSGLCGKLRGGRVGSAKNGEMQPTRLQYADYRIYSSCAPDLDHYRRLRSTRRAASPGDHRPARDPGHAPRARSCWPWACLSPRSPSTWPSCVR